MTVFREQSYFCKAGQSYSQEQLMRYAIHSKSHAVTFFQTSGMSLANCNNKSKTDIPRFKDTWRPEMENLTEWRPSAKDVLAKKERLLRFNAEIPTG